MSFTDDDLKRLKEFAECGDPTSHRVLSSEEMAALIARLEAAERLAQYCLESRCGLLKDRIAWLKAAGK